MASPRSAFSSCCGMNRCPRSEPANQTQGYPSKSPSWSQSHGLEKPCPCTTKAISEAACAINGASPASTSLLMKVLASSVFIKPTLLIVPSAQNDPFGHEPLNDDIPPGKRAQRNHSA